MIKIPTIEEMLKQYDIQIEKEVGNDPKNDDLKAILRVNFKNQLEWIQRIFGEPK